MKALDLLQPNETAVVIFTDGLNLELDLPNGQAFTAWWRMAESRKADRVIIYKSGARKGHADLYVADYVRKEKRDKDGRFKIYLAHVTHAGSTDRPWYDFTGAERGAQNVVRYLTK